MWAVSRKRMGKHVATERLILGNQLATEHGFHEYENWKLQTRFLRINARFPRQRKHEDQ
jgi:hypothetical protein